jgi:POT family proton-dependent oligopeptide transporter
MVYAERYVGFWLAYLIPTIFFLVCLPVLWMCKKHYVLKPPSGSVMAPAFKLFGKALGNGMTLNPLTTWRNWNNGTMWHAVKPSTLGSSAPAWYAKYNFDDAWVDEVARGFAACSVFFWVPIFWLAYRQMDSNLTNMCATMKLGGVPNDILSNLDPIAIIIIVPIMDSFVYPFLRRKGINFSPIKKITAGFILGSFSMVWAAVLQHYVYKTSGFYETGDPDYKSPITVWAVTGVYILIATSEIFASVTTLEYAFTKAPKNMRLRRPSLLLPSTPISCGTTAPWPSLPSSPVSSSTSCTATWTARRRSSMPFPPDMLVPRGSWRMLSIALALRRIGGPALLCRSTRRSKCGSNSWLIDAWMI